MSQKTDDAQEKFNDVAQEKLSAVANKVEDSHLSKISKTDIQRLIDSSRQVMGNAYCEYSHFRVGAALLTEDGKIYTGCNVENVSYSLTICAERTAIVKAVSDGHRKFKAIAISSDVKEKFTYPCGACRQVMVEFGDYHVIVSKPDGTHDRTTVQNLLPHFFSKDALFSVQKTKAHK